MLTQLTPNDSSWIRAIGYRNGYLAIFADDFAWLFADVPPTMPGLLVAGHVNAKDGSGLSIGAAVHRLMLRRESKYPRQKISDEWQMAVLRRQMRDGKP